MTTHLREAWRRVAGIGTIPKAPETSPIPSGHYRLFHRTPVGNADSIRRSGLGAEYSRQHDFTGEMVWGTYGFFAAIGSVDHVAQSQWAIVEYHVEWSVMGTPPQTGGAYTSGSIPPSQIIAIWEPWHFAVWVIASEVGTISYPTLDDLEFLRRDGEAWSQALDWLARNQAPSWMRTRP